MSVFGNVGIILLDLEVSTTVVLKNSVFFDIMPYSVVTVDGFVAGIYRLHLQG
jgi:hypothetical protein